MSLPASLQAPLATLGQAHLQLVTLFDIDMQDAMEAEEEEEVDDLADQHQVFEVLGIAYTAISRMDDFFYGRLGPRGPYNQIGKSEDFFRVSLSWPERWFRKQFRCAMGKNCDVRLLTLPSSRMSRQTFDWVVALLEENPIFKSTGRRPQRLVKFQLATFLVRYGMRGADTLSVAQQLSLGHGTVFLYCRRVIYALRCLRLRFVQWPRGDAKDEIKDFIEEEFNLPGVIGIVDGSLIPFARVPKVDSNLWYTRKKFPGVSLLQYMIPYVALMVTCRLISKQPSIICDDSRRTKSAIAGPYPMSKSSRRAIFGDTGQRTLRQEKSSLPIKVSWHILSREPDGSQRAS